MAATPDDRKEIRYFVTYAHANQTMAERLLKDLRAQLDASRRYRHVLWKDTTHLLIGCDWDKRIREALAACDYGLVLASPELLGSSYVKAVELPAFVGGSKPCLPVLLHPIDFERQDLRGLERLQIFAMKAGRNGPRKAFDESTSRRFCEQLFRAIEDRLDADAGGVAL